jgi:hypothetical protein
MDINDIFMIIISTSKLSHNKFKIKQSKYVMMFKSTQAKYLILLIFTRIHRYQVTNTKLNIIAIKDIKLNLTMKLHITIFKTKQGIQMIYVVFL